jgi:hypothetical protein
MNLAGFIAPLSDFRFNDFPLPFIERAEPFAQIVVIHRLATEESSHPSSFAA